MECDAIGLHNAVCCGTAPPIRWGFHCSKVDLLLIMMITRQSSGDAFLPTQAQLARMANVSSADTIILE